jgi:hypothetical protein
MDAKKRSDALLDYFGVIDYDEETFDEFCKSSDDFSTEFERYIFRMNSAEHFRSRKVCYVSETTLNSIGSQFFGDSNSQAH